MLEISSFYHPNKKIKFPKIKHKNIDESLKTILNEADIIYLKKKFNKYFNILVNNSLNLDSKKILMDYQSSFEHYFYMEFKNFFLSNEIYRECVNENKTKIDLYLHQRFFYVNLAFWGLASGLNELLKISKKGLRVTNSLSKHNSELYSEVWDVIENQVKINKTIACEIVAKNHPEEKDELLTELYKRFTEYMRRHKIKSKEDWVRYLSTFENL